MRSGQQRPKSATPAAMPGVLRMLIAGPLAVLQFYVRWGILIRVGGLGGDRVARARRWARWERRHRRGPRGEVMARLDFWAFFFSSRRAPALVWLSVLGLPLIGAWRAWRVARTHGRSVRTAHGLSISRQALDIWLLQLRFPLTYAPQPQLYYFVETYLPDRRIDAPFAFSVIHQNALTRAVNGAAAGFMDKRDFARRCAAAGLPHISSIVELERDGRTMWSDGAARLPRTDLFSKPATDANGVGAARWIFEDGRYRSETGALLAADDVVRQLRADARRGPIVVQPRLQNHPAVERLVGSTLATVRFSSLLLPDGTFEPIIATQRSAVSDASVDNSSKGGAASPVDLATGTLGRLAIIAAPGVARTDVHPRTGQTVVGQRLPGWHAIRSLVERAHREFAEYPTIGWDVAVTPDGPVLVEANVIWVANSIQAAHGVAFGRLPYAEQLLAHLEQRVATSEPDYVARPAPARDPPSES